MFDVLFFFSLLFLLPVAIILSAMQFFKELREWRTMRRRKIKLLILERERIC